MSGFYALLRMVRMMDRLEAKADKFDKTCELDQARRAKELANYLCGAIIEVTVSLKQ